LGDNNIVEDILDLLGFIILLGVVITVGVGIVVPAMHNSFFTDSLTLYDKTAPKAEGFENPVAYDGKLSKMEVALMMRVQDYGIPEPNRFKVHNDLYEVQSSYEVLEEFYADEVFKTLHALDPNNVLRYRWRYNYGSPPTIDDIDTGNLVTNPKAESYTSTLLPVGWNWYTSYPSEVTFQVRTSDSWVISGLASFEIMTTSNITGMGRDYTGYYFQDVSLEPSKKYRFTATVSCHRCEGYIEARVVDSSGNETEHKSSKVRNTATPQKLVVEFNAPMNASYVRLMLKKDVTRDGVQGYSDHLFADDVSLQILDGSDPHYYLSTD